MRPKGAFCDVTVQIVRVTPWEGNRTAKVQSNMHSCDLLKIIAHCRNRIQYPWITHYENSLFKYTENFTTKNENFQIKNPDIFYTYEKGKGSEKNNPYPWKGDGLVPILWGLGYRFPRTRTTFSWHTISLPIYR